MGGYVILNGIMNMHKWYGTQLEKDKYKYKDTKMDRGFSIVEIIIAIVIIAILASITIVSYAWMTRDARNAKYFAEVTELLKAIELYQTKYGSILKGTRFENGGAVICLAENTREGMCHWRRWKGEEFTPVSQFVDHDNIIMEKLKKVGFSKKPILPVYKNAGCEPGHYSPETQVCGEEKIGSFIMLGYSTDKNRTISFISLEGWDCPNGWSGGGSYIRTYLGPEEGRFNTCTTMDPSRGPHAFSPWGLAIRRLI